MQAQELLDKNIKYGCVFGPAGSGKTFLIREAIKLDPKFGLLTATTGTAARIIGPDTRTVHSAVGVFDLASLWESASKGDLHDVLTNIRKDYDRLIIDECSMLERAFFETLTDACVEADLGIILVGDFLQLPSVSDAAAPWLFQSSTWEKFSENIVTLETQHRFSNDEYLIGMNFLRRGEGAAAISHFQKAGVQFLPDGTSNDDFTGTTITATKARRNVINSKRFAALSGKSKKFETTKAGAQLPEWAEIPDSIELKLGTRVMILRNLYEKTDGVETLVQANGDMGIIEKMNCRSVHVRRDGGDLVKVEIFTAHNGCQHKGHDGVQHFTIMDKRPTGQIEYLPLALAWGLNVHKCQGATLNNPTRVVMEKFFSSPAMCYVACSRVADPKNLTLVGAGTLGQFGDLKVKLRDTPLLAEYCNVSDACVEYV